MTRFLLNYHCMINELLVLVGKACSRPPWQHMLGELKRFVNIRIWGWNRLNQQNPLYSEHKIKIAIFSVNKITYVISNLPHSRILTGKPQIEKRYKLKNKSNAILIYYIQVIITRRNYIKGWVLVNEQAKKKAKSMGYRPVRGWSWSNTTAIFLCIYLQ